MRRLLLWVLGIAFVCGALSTRYEWAPGDLPVGPGRRFPGVPMPDSRLTPGDVRPGVGAGALCRAGAARSAGTVPADRQAVVFARYRIPVEQQGGYTIDHLVPVSLGGSSAVANLWPQRSAGPAGAPTKDKLERRLHRLVCEGKLALRDAQRQIASDWYLAWNNAGRP